MRHVKRWNKSVWFACLISLFITQLFINRQGKEILFGQFYKYAQVVPFLKCLFAYIYLYLEKAHNFCQYVAPRCCRQIQHGRSEVQRALNINSCVHCLHINIKEKKRKNCDRTQCRLTWIFSATLSRWRSSRVYSREKFWYVPYNVPHLALLRTQSSVRSRICVSVYRAGYCCTSLVDGGFRGRQLRQRLLRIWNRYRARDTQFNPQRLARNRTARRYSPTREYIFGNLTRAYNNVDRTL